MISDEESISVKQQILKYIEDNFPEDKKDLAKRKIATMNNEQLEDFLKQNSEQNSSQNSSNPFRAIIEGTVPYFEIGKSKDALAVLEINPVSSGHTIIIPKKQTKNKISKIILNFAGRISKKIKKELNPQEILIQEKEILGEKIIDLIPIYNEEDRKFERKKAEEEELEEMQKKLGEKKKAKKIKKEKIKVEENFWLPKRIP